MGGRILGLFMLHLILSLLAMSGIAGLLALLLEVADSYIADYGEAHILVNEQKDLVVKGGSPLLFSLMEEGIFLPSACGGKGTCALCKVKVLEGGGPVLPTETPYLNPQEISTHVRLSCQLKVRNDLKIQIPEKLFLIKEFRGKVVHIQDLTPSIKRVRLQILSPEEGLSFRPGQYVQLEVPRYERTREPEYRAYSVASSAEERHALDLIITKVPEGVVSTYVHEYLKEGDQLRVMGPYGDFYLRESPRDILMIATGSGLAPIRSILYQIEREEITRRVTFFFGARTQKDLYDVQELERFAQIIPDFTFVPTLSRPNPEEPWEGERGRVTDLIKKDVPLNANLDVYICGNPAMVESCLELLREKGIPRERIYYDKFA